MGVIPLEVLKTQLKNLHKDVGALKKFYQGEIEVREGHRHGEVEKLTKERDALLTQSELKLTMLNA